MREHTHREFKLWMTYLDDEWYHPTRSDYYLMRIAQRVQQVAFQVWGKDSSKIKLSHQEVFAKPEKQTIKSTEEKEHSKTMVEYSKSVWAGLVGLVRKKKEDSEK